MVIVRLAEGAVLDTADACAYTGPEREPLVSRYLLPHRFCTGNEEWAGIDRSYSATTCVIIFEVRKNRRGLVPVASFGLLRRDIFVDAGESVDELEM